MNWRNNEFCCVNWFQAPTATPTYTTGNYIQCIINDSPLFSGELMSKMSPLKSSKSDYSWVIKSPQYTGGDFMFLYRFVRRRRPRPQILVHAITFEQLLGFLSFLAQLLALTCRLPDYIFVDFRRDLDLDFSRSNMEFAISQPNMVRLPRNEKQT